MPCQISPGRKLTWVHTMSNFAWAKIDMHVPMSIFTQAKNGHNFSLSIFSQRHIFGPLSQFIALQTTAFFIFLPTFPYCRLNLTGNFHLQPAFPVQVFQSNFGFKTEAPGEPIQANFRSNSTTLFLIFLHFYVYFFFWLPNLHSDKLSAKCEEFETRKFTKNKDEVYHCPYFYQKTAFCIGRQFPRNKRATSANNTSMTPAMSREPHLQITI